MDRGVSTRELEQQTDPDEFTGTAALFSALTAVMTAVVYLALRLGFREHDLGPVLKTLSLSLFLVLLPQACRLCFRWVGRSTSGRWFLSDAALSLCGVLIVVLCNLAPLGLGQAAAWVFWLCGPAFLGIVAVSWWQGGGVKENLAFIGLVALFGLWCGARLYGANYHDPIFMETITVGRAHLDELFVAAGTNMIKTYGIPSTGLDGLPVLQYHWGGWWALAQMADLLSLPATKFIHIGYPVIFVPLLLSALIGFALDTRRALPGSSTGRALRRDFLFWLVLFAATVGFLPPAVSSFMEMGLPASESYTASLYLFFRLLSLALCLADYALARRAPMGLSEGVLCAVVLPVLLGMLFLAKISTGFLAAVVGGYLFLRLKLYRNVWFFLSFAAGSGAAILALVYLSLGSGGSTPPGSIISPFHFLLTHVPPWLRVFFVPVHYFWAGLFIAGALYSRNLRDKRAILDAVGSARTVDVEVLIVLCVVGAAPGLLLPIGGGSAYYFSHIQVCLAVALVLGNLDAFRNAWIYPEVGGLQSVRPVTSGTRVPRYATGVLVGLVFIGVVLNAVETIAYTAYRNISTRLCLCNGERVRSNQEVGCGGKAWAAEFQRDMVHALTRPSAPSVKQVVREDLVRLFSTVQDGLKRADRYPLVKTLVDLESLPLETKRRTLVFIPQANRQYWDLIDPAVTGAFNYPACEAVPLIAPTLTGIGMIDGLPGPDCDLYAFGYHSYAKRTRPQNELDTQPETLCAKVLSKGFSRVVVVETARDGTPSTRSIECTEP